MEQLKTFQDLEFKEYSKQIPNHYQAIIEFENGYGLSVLKGIKFNSNGNDTYEVRVLYKGRIAYGIGLKEHKLNGVSVDEINEIMKKIQRIKVK